jgi:hypothetical protein
VNRDRILYSIGLARELVAGFSLDVKMKILRLFSPFSQRVRLLETKHWSFEEYRVSDLGTVLPCVGDLPPEEIVKSFVDAADFVRRQAESRSCLNSIRYIRSMSQVADILETIPVMVIEPGNEQRRPNVMEARGRKNLQIYPSEGYIEDGNHRAFALMLANPRRPSIRCWVGR